MTTKEIITLQFGHYANFIGANWWNTQEAGFQYEPNESSPNDINHDVLFREGLTPKGQVTFTPRCLLVDLKGSLGTLSQQGNLYEEIPEPSLSSAFWDQNAVKVECDIKVPKNELQEALQQDQPELSGIKSKNLEKNINVWSDLLYTRYHPRTVNIVNEYNHNSDENGFDVFNLGKDVWKSDFGDDFIDKIRMYMEESDNLQGFQIIVDSYNGFGGLSSSCLEHIKDEYDKKSILAIPVIPSHYRDYNFSNSEEREISIKLDGIRTINTLLTIDALTENSCLSIPLSMGALGWRQPGPKRVFKYLKYNHEYNYHTSAILSSLLDTLTLAYRLKNTSYTINDFCTYQNTHGRKLAAASLGLPFGINYGEDLLDYLDKFEGQLWQSLTPNCRIESDKINQQISLRGIPLARLKQPVEQAKKQRDMPAYKCDSVQNMLQYYLQCTCLYSVNRVTTSNAAMSVKMPFPEIFHENIDTYGNVINQSRNENEGVHSVPVLAGCHTGSFLGETLGNLHRESKRYKISKIHQFKLAGLEDDEYKECLNRILDLQDCYEDDM